MWPFSRKPLTLGKLKVGSWFHWKSEDERVIAQLYQVKEVQELVRVEHDGVEVWANKFLHVVKVREPRHV